MKFLLLGFVCLATICPLFSGCDQRSINKSAFDKAQPEVKQIWEKALAASKSHNYLAANTNFVSLLQGNITPEQLVATQDALANLHEQMFAAAAKGDPAAKTAVAALNAMATNGIHHGRVPAGKPN